MNSICLSTHHDAAALPVLGLDVAKKSVQAQLRISGQKVRFAFANSTEGFAQLARILKEHSVLKAWAGLEATGPYSHALTLWLHAQGHRVSLISLHHGNRPRWKWRNCRPWCVAVKKSLSCCRPKRIAWKGSLLTCAAL